MRRKQATELYEEFHKYGPKRIGAFPESFSIPSRASFAGPALYILYESPKLDPITYAVPDAPINYIHEHKAGVKVYWCDEGSEETRVLSKICNAENLTGLGKCLGFGYIDDEDDEMEIECDPSRVRLYGVKLAKKKAALLVVQDQKKVLAMIWGGKLDIEPRGIVG